MLYCHFPNGLHMFSPATMAPSHDIMCNYPLMNSLALTCNWPIRPEGRIYDLTFTIIQIYQQDITNLQ